MADVIPLPSANPEHDPTSPEALFISAMIATGEFTPGKWQISDADLSCFVKLFRFSVEYQRKSQAAPPLELLAAKYPEFKFIPGIDLAWAAAQLHDASYARDVRRGVRDVIRELGDGDYTAVSTALEALRRPHVGQQVRGVPVFDPSNVAEQAVKTGIPVPWPTLDNATGGIGADELWGVGARFSVGKSYFVTAMAGTAAEAGRRVRVVSLEMPARKMNLRIARYHARNDKALQNRLSTPGNPRDREEALEEICGQIPGYVETFDFSHGSRITTATIEDACDGTDLLFIDHVGLLSLHDGRRAIEDWRVAAQISNMLREINLRCHVPIVMAVQINREGDGTRPPKASKLAQTDAFGQDPDNVITAAKYSTHSRAFSLEKNREGPEAFWYTRFNPVNADYTEITKELADADQLHDQDRKASR